MKTAVTTATRPVGLSLRRDRVQGKGCGLPLGKKILKINSLRCVFRSLFFIIFAVSMGWRMLH